MEETPAVPSTANAPVNESLCVNCQANAYAEGHKTKLCGDCRQKFVKFPIPRWIWIFAGVILLVMIAGLVRMPRYFSAAMHLSRAEKAIDAKRYRTAGKELKQVLLNFPGNAVANGKLLIASVKNIDFKTFSEVYTRLQNEKFTDQELLREMEANIVLAQSFFARDTALGSRVQQIKSSKDSLVQLFDLLESRQDDDLLIGGIAIGNALYDLQEYTAAEKILNSVLAKQYDYPPALALMAPTKRSLGKYDEALSFCDKALENNSEDITSIAQKARIELKRKDDAKAALYARQAMELEPEDLFAMETQAMVDFYAGRKDNSLKILAAIRAQEVPTGDETISNRLQAIINGSTLYR